MRRESKTKYTEVKKIIITDEYSLSRLDNCLISQLKGIPKSKIYSIIRKGEVRVNGSRSKPDRKLIVGDIVRIPPLFLVKTENSFPASDSLKQIIINNIIYNERSILIINKPIGLASHGGSGISLGLIEAIRQINPRFKKAQLVHRLDKETSGCIVLALKRSVLRTLNEELREGRVIKYYTAIVNGKWPNNLTLVKSNLKKNQLLSGERQVRTSMKGKESKTKFKLLKYKNNLSLLECELLTGRTHQIRVQTSDLGFPIVGDKKYGDRKVNNKFKLKGVKRMLLHATTISFPEINLTCSSVVPSIFKQLVEK